jgi:hypothetical protein
MVLDIRWTTTLVLQASDTRSSAPSANGISYVNAGKDQQLAVFIQAARKGINEPLARILIYADAKEAEFLLLRAKYHLLPHATYVHAGDIAALPNVPFNYVLAINSISLEPGRSTSDRSNRARALEGKFGAGLKVILEDDFATFYAHDSSD